MIKSIYMKNFFSYSDTTVDLNDDLNITIGINGSGKSNLIKAIRLLKEGIAGIGLKNLIINNWGGFDNICFYDPNEKNVHREIIIEYRLDGRVLKQFGFRFQEDVYYRIVIKEIPNKNNYYVSETIYLPREMKEHHFIYLNIDNGKGELFGKLNPLDKNESDNQVFSNKYGLIPYQSDDPQELTLGQIKDSVVFYIQDTIRKALSEMIAYDYFDTTPTSKIRKPMIPTSEKRLLPDGSNLLQILNTIDNEDRNSFQSILEKLQDVNENYSDINFHIIGTNFELMLAEKNLSKSIHVSQISDGTLRYLCLLSIFYNKKRGKLICIDEPETGLHPDMIFTITSLFQECARDTQFIIATHSEDILNAFKLENIIVLEKDEKNCSYANYFSENDFKEWYEDFFPGKMWRSGDIGGNRW